MTWRELFPFACLLLYAGAAVVYAWEGQRWMALMYAAYAVANIGIIGVAVTRR